MTPEAQRIAIAEACGWKHDDSYNSRHGWKHPDGCYYGTGELPNYLSDLNAMHEAEKVLTTQQGRDMMMLLTTLTDSFWRATAPQRAEAFLRTLNLWKDNA